MYQSDDPRPLIPQWITDAYAVICTHIDNSEGDGQSQRPAIARERAVEVLLATDELALEPQDVEHALERLLARGYFYEVDAELHVIIPSE